MSHTVTQGRTFQLPTSSSPDMALGSGSDLAAALSAWKICTAHRGLVTQTQNDQRHCIGILVFLQQITPIVCHPHTAGDLLHGEKRGTLFFLQQITPILCHPHTAGVLLHGKKGTQTVASSCRTRIHYRNRSMLYAIVSPTQRRTLVTLTAVHTIIRRIALVTLRTFSPCSQIKNLFVAVNHPTTITVIDRIGHATGSRRECSLACTTVCLVFVKKGE